MKTKVFPFLLVATTALSSAFGFSATSAEANPASSFYCGNDAGVPVTIVNHPQHGTVTLIRWVSDYFEASGYDPQTRCDIVSQRFQTYKDNGTLTYLTTGLMNRQNVICISSRNGGECEGLLFTLKPFSNPDQTLQDLTDLRASARNASALSETSGRLYINFEDFVREKAEAQPEETVPVDSALF